MDVNTTILQELHDSITNWQRKKARLEEEHWDYNTEEEKQNYNKFEKAMDEYENALTYAENEYGMRPIGEGRDRITFTSGKSVSSKVDVVIKMSKSDGGQQNMEEVELYNMFKKDIDEDVDKYVAPILRYEDNYRWIIQQRASQGSPPGASKELRDKFDKIGWYCSDIRPENVGIIDSEAVLIDLGLGLRKL